MAEVGRGPCLRR